MQSQDFGSLDEANDFLQRFAGVGKIPVVEKHDPLEQAQDVMYEAWNAEGKRRVELARKALTISPDCADAYVLLAEETATSVREARKLYEEGVKAGERALGPQTFEEEAGQFWSMIETRPYMRAREGLAQVLWALGEKREAAGHFREMLRLNPNDNQGIRYFLARLLLELGADKELGELLGQFKDDAMAEWNYMRALRQFRRSGAGDEANRLLKRAIKQNRFVPHYLLGTRKMPARLPETMGWGDENEAIAYAADNLRYWQETRGALAWLYDTIHRGRAV
ncbi:MAG: tetratricopeptide repeat protein [Chloroflexi bacterium]|nr:tetratricopeptide repeat protein [Chloroflexota bacterium]MBI3732154.1 tetratricopeptide repeat protein [Chloroflexota bacterium]